MNAVHSLHYHMPYYEDQKTSTYFYPNSTVDEYIFEITMQNRRKRSSIGLLSGSDLWILAKLENISDFHTSIDRESSVGYL